MGEQKQKQDDKQGSGETFRRADKHKSKSQKKSWYKRRLYYIPLIVLAVALAAAAVFGLILSGAVELSSGSEQGLEMMTVSVASGEEDKKLTPEEQILASMTVEQKVGQMMMAGFEGTGAGEDVKSLLQDYHIGGFILYDRNLDSQEQVSGMNTGLQQLAVQAGHPARLLIAIDQEGGATRRMDDIGPFYSEPMIGEMGDIGGEVAEQQASSTARSLKKIGINTNLAPVVDVSDGWGTIMDVRSYGTDPEYVAELSAMAVEGYKKATTISCAKHFPGHGSADTDSEYELPYVPTSRELLDQYELVPFHSVIEAGVPMIMVGHLVVPALDPDEVPATLSKPIITDLLRGEMGYAGVIITDDMEMGAITNDRDVPEAAVLAVEAGADIVMVAHTYDTQVAVHKALVDAVNSGRLTEDRLDESVMRILEMKEKYRLEI